jgi:hypothetical protein
MLPDSGRPFHSTLCLGQCHGLVNEDRLGKMHVILSKPNIKKTDTLFSLMTSVPLICDPKNIQEFQKIHDQSFENLPETHKIYEFYFALSKITGFVS